MGRGEPRKPWHRAEALTVDQGAVQPLHVVVVRKRQQDLVADDGEGQEQHGARGHGQGEGAQEQPATEDGVSPPSGQRGRGSHSRVKPLNIHLKQTNKKGGRLS